MWREGPSLAPQQLSCTQERDEDVWGRQSDGVLSFQHYFPSLSPVPKFRARWGARRCWWQSALPASKSERPSGDPSGLQRSSWPRSSGGLWRRCTTPASWAEPSCTATSAWSCGHWSLETAATSPCCWWTRKVEPGPRPCSSRCMVSAPDSGSLPHLLPQSSRKASWVLKTGENWGLETSGL